MSAFSESCVGQAGLAWLKSLGRQFKHGPDISAAGNTLTLALCQRERKSCSELLPAPRLRDALARLNPTLPVGALEDAFRNLTRPDLPAAPGSAPAGGADLLQRNRAGHRLWVDSVTVEYRTVGGGIRSAPVRAMDLDNSDNNDWLAVNQCTVVESRHSRRPDIVRFVKGLPLAVIELKSTGDPGAAIWMARQQLQTYQAEIPSLSAPNAVLVGSDALEARVRLLRTGREWFKLWQTITGAFFCLPCLPHPGLSATPLPVVEGLGVRVRSLAEGPEVRVGPPRSSMKGWAMAGEKLMKMPRAKVMRHAACWQDAFERDGQMQSWVSYLIQLAAAASGSCAERSISFVSEYSGQGRYCHANGLR